jgi:hypothetical protein
MARLPRRTGPTEPRPIVTVRRRWIAAWGGGALIGVANGVLREATFAKLLSERAAHAASGATAVLAFAGYFSVLQRRWPIPTSGEALRIGGSWLAMTVAFEFGFGRAVAKESWQELLDDYNLAEGRTWPLVLAWIALGPAVVRELQAR